MTVKKLIQELIALCYPRLCLGCKHQLAVSPQILCVKCAFQLDNSKGSNTAVLTKIVGGRVPLNSSHSLYLFQKGTVIQQLLHELKYNGKRRVGEFLGEMLAVSIAEIYRPIAFDAIVAVPLHPKKEAIRGYNQSLIIAEELGKLLQLEVLKGRLIRQEETTSQTKKKRFERTKNTLKAFKLIEGHSLANKHLLLIDDVLTTGATIEGVWQVLKEVEGLQLSLATVA